MAVKYECPKCSRRFTEWGAEKFGFKCPGDEWCPAERPKDIELIRVGASETKPGRRPSLKRIPRRATPIPVPIENEEEEGLINAEFEPEADAEVDDEIPLVPAEPDEAVAFGADGPGIVIDETVTGSIDELGIPDVELFDEAAPLPEEPGEIEEPPEEWNA